MGRLIVARDPMGVTSLYQGWNSNAPDAVFFASELKALHPVCDYIISFPPGHTFDSTGKPYERFYNPQWKIPNHMPSEPVDYTLLRASFEQAVRKRLMSDVPYGVLLSGGLDSSLVASIAAREVAKASGRQNRQSNGVEGPLSPQKIGSRLSTFSIGLKDSPDIASALKVAEFLGTDHHTYHFTCEEGIAALSDVIYHIESYDVTSIRASTPMYLLSKHIKAAGYKMVLSGEGSDAIFGGYLYSANAPNLEAFQRELVGRIGELQFFDCLRTHKSTMAWGVEARVPFLDKQVSSVQPSSTLGIPLCSNTTDSLWTWPCQ